MYAFCWSAPVRLLRPSMAVLYHVSGKLQRTYLKQLGCFIVCFVGWTHHWYGSSCPTLSLGYIDRRLERRTLHRAHITQVHIRALRSGDGEDNVKKNNRVRLAKQQLCTCSTLFCSFLRHDRTATTWKCLILRFREVVKKPRRNCLSRCELMIVFVRNSTPGEFACFWQSNWVGIIVMKIERTQINFLTDLFAAVAVLGS